MGSSFDTPENDTDSAQPAKHSGSSAEEQLLQGSLVSATRTLETESDLRHYKTFRGEKKKMQRRNKHLRNKNKILKARVDQLTAECHNLQMENASSDKAHKDIVCKISIPYAIGEGLHAGDLTKEPVEAIRGSISREVGVAQHLRTQVKDLEAQTQVLGEELMASRLECQSLEERQRDQDARLQESLQNTKSYKEKARGLRTQVQALQKELLARVSNTEVVSDEVFFRDFRALASLIKSLSRSIQPAQEIDTLDALKPYLLLEDVSKHHWDTRARKKSYVEAWIWSVLILTVFKYSFGFCEDLKVINQDWGFIFGRNGYADWPVSTPESETWRLTTVKTFVEQIGQETVTAGKHPGNAPQSVGKNRHLQKQVIRERRHIASIIRTNLLSIALTSDLSQVSDIVNQAFALALNMAMQRFRVQVTWPDVGDAFEASQMSSIPGCNGEIIHRGVVAFVVNPGLTRWGDIHGQNLDMCHEIVPSLVQLEPVQTRREPSHGHVYVKQEAESGQ